MGFNGDYPLVMTNIAIENGPVEIVSFPINSMVDLSIATLNYQRVTRLITYFPHRLNQVLAVSAQD